MDTEHNRERIEVVVGRIGKPHGLRGEVTVEVRTDEPERRFVAGTTLVVEPPRADPRDAVLPPVAGTGRG